jgi:hypothetical protein
MSKEEMKPKEAISEIISNLKKGDTEVKLHGEVITPLFLVEEMLDLLPKKVWSNPNLKWLDPCNGMGTFFSIALERLMDGLLDFQPNDELRYKHIVENMFWACEIQEVNMKTYFEIFNPNQNYKMNSYLGSYLEDDFINNIGIEKFDVILMNPPYQILKQGNKKSQPLWDKFVIKAISELVEGGYLVAVHPDGWRGLGKVFNKVKQVLKSKQMICLEVHNANDGVKTFGVQIPYDFYCIRNIPYSFNTKIKCSDEITQKIDISKREFIPNGMFKEFDKLIAVEDEKIHLLQDSTYHTQNECMYKKQTEEYIYPCVYTTTKDGSVNLWYSNVNKGHFGIPKVIFTNGSATHPIIDEFGEYGLTQFAYGIVDSVQNLPYIQKALLNPEFLKLISFSDGLTNAGRHLYNPKVIALFRKDFWKDFI